MTEFDNIEFFRSGYGMLPELGDKDPGMPLCVPRSAGGGILTGKCDCRESRKREGCAHFERLTRAVGRIRERQGGHSWGEAFAGRKAPRSNRFRDRAGLIRNVAAAACSWGV